MENSNGNGIDCGIVHTEHFIFNYGSNDYNSFCGMVDEAMCAGGL